MPDDCSGDRYASDSFLLVGGEPPWQYEFQKLLEKNGHAVLATGYGEPALRAARVFSPDVVIVSLASDESACETARRLRELPIGDMYTLIALGECKRPGGWPAADFDIVMDEVHSYGGLMQALHEMDEAWTVRLPDAPQAKPA